MSDDLAAPRPSVRLGPDGRDRCAWVGTDPLYAAYHDDEWGIPLHGDRALFEKITLEAFQSGLSWITILRRREGFRRAFEGFDWSVIAEYGDADVARLLDDTGIIRNRAKIAATIHNARILREWLGTDASEHHGALDDLVWSHRPVESRPRPRTLAELPATTPESIALARALQSRGFRFVGPTTVYALMQSAGLVDDHVEGCWRPN